MTTVTFSRAAPLPTTALVVYGAKGAGTPSIMADGLQVPQPSPLAEFAPASKWINGEAAVSVRTPNAVLGLKLRFEAADEAAFQTLLTTWRAALRQLSCGATVNLGNDSQVWVAAPGTLVLTNGQRQPHKTGDPVVDYFTATIPVHPFPVGS